MLGKPRTDLEAVRQELLLVGEEAVPPLVAALGSGRHPAPHEVVEVLVRFMVRLDEPAIENALVEHLGTYPDQRVRADIARGLGMHGHRAAIDALLDALSDEAPDVRYESLFALSFMATKLSDEQMERARHLVKSYVSDEDSRVRREAGIFKDQIVGRWLTRAKAHDLRAEAAQAESLYFEALAYAPDNKRANYLLGMFYLTSQREEEGMSILREHRMVLDVPLLAKDPEMDGRLEEREWRQAAAFTVPYLFTHEHPAALPADEETDAFIYRTGRALHIGVRAKDEHPDSLMVQDYNPREMKKSADWNEDFIELFLDMDFDRQDHAFVSINSAATAAGYIDTDQGNMVPWNAHYGAATHVGEDYWSIEFELELGREGVPQPGEGERWGFNLGRMFRASHYSVWVRTQTGTHDPSEYGMLVF